MKELELAKVLKDMTKPKSNTMYMERGIVTSTNPLELKVGDKKILTEEFLIVSETLKEKKFVIGGVEYYIFRDLQVGDSVYIIMFNDGQKYFVLERG